jgi:CubicO group peptidase (beta-lactamase class C family)
VRLVAPSVAFAAGLLAVSAAMAQSLAPATPESVGFNPERLGRISQTLRDDVAKGTLPGAVLLIARDGKVAYHEAFGSIDPQTKAPMTKDAIFRIYSMTKPFTSVSAMMLVEDGKIALGDPVAKYIPAFKDVKVGVERTEGGAGPTLELVAARRPMTVHDLMRHVAGLTYGVFGQSLVKAAYRDAKLFDGDPDNAEFADRVAKLPLMFQPGTTWEYSHATDILGRVVEVAAGKSLYGFMKERLFDPLGMPDTAFYVPDAARHAHIAEPFQDDRQIGAGSFMFDPRVTRKWESGGGGSMGTAMDYARFLQMMLDGGTAQGKRYLGPKTVAYMTSDHLGEKLTGAGPSYLPGEGYGFGLGFAVRKETGLSPLPGTAGDYTWGGAGGTYMWADPKERMFVVFMMQSPKQRLYYRSLLKGMVYSAIERSHGPAAQN